MSRSYDPLDTSREVASIQGVLLRSLFTGRLRTRNPLWIAAAGLGGGVLLLPAIGALYELLTGSRALLSQATFGSILGMIIMAFIGGALLATCFLNLSVIVHRRRAAKSAALQRQKSRKKKKRTPRE